MTTEPWIAWAAYLLWLACGLCDFIAHWRTDLAHTSGVAESAAHLVQLALLGVAVVLGLGFEAGQGSIALLLAIVFAHAVVGYVDTRIAFAAPREDAPGVQHMHCLLDMARWVSLAWLVASTWRAAAVAGWRVRGSVPARR
jgi:hypothetical protein